MGGPNSAKNTKMTTAERDAVDSRHEDSTSPARGKMRRAELRALLDEYVHRIARSCSMEVSEVRDAAAALKRLDADRAATAVLLDAGGKPCDSRSVRKLVA